MKVLFHPLAEKARHHKDGVGQGIFDLMYEKFPVEYFWGSVTLAKVLKIETGKPGDFEKPSTPEEALERSERNCGPQARKIFERVLDQVGKAEAKYAIRGSGSAIRGSG